MPTFAEIRRVVVFVLGVLVILDGLYGDKNSTAELVIGMVLVGVLPISDLALLRRGRMRRAEHDEP